MRPRIRIMLGLPWLLAGLGGCALPVPVAMTSYAVDGIFYLGTGKTATDHALSAAMAQDCVMWRVLNEEPICIDPDTLEDVPSGETLAAAGAPAPLWPAADVDEAPTSIAILPDDAPASARAALLPGLVEPAIPTPIRSDPDPVAQTLVARYPVPPTRPARMQDPLASTVVLPPALPEARRTVAQVAEIPLPPAPVR